MSDINPNSGGFGVGGVYAPDGKDWFANVVFSMTFSLWAASGIEFSEAREQMSKANERIQAIKFPWEQSQEVNANEV